MGRKTKANFFSIVLPPTSWCFKMVHFKDLFVIRGRNPYSIYYIIYATSHVKASTILLQPSFELTIGRLYTLKCTLSSPESCNVTIIPPPHLGLVARDIHGSRFCIENKLPRVWLLHSQRETVATPYKTKIHLLHINGEVGGPNLIVPSCRSAKKVGVVPLE